MSTQLEKQYVQKIGRGNYLFAPNGVLTLQQKQGPIIDIYPAEVVEPIRHMITQSIYRNEFPKRISMVSAMQEEGVTYISRAVAASLAHDTGRRVCLVDLNWWSPNNMTTRLLRNQPGITDVLYKSTSLDSAMVQTTNPFLHMLPSGGVDPRQRPILSRDKELAKLIDMLSDRYDHIILDIPAIRSTSDSVALASLSESCCVVVRHGATSINVVGQVLSEIDHIPVMGVIMNRVNNKIPKWIQNLIPQN